VRGGGGGVEEEARVWDMPLGGLMKKDSVSFRLLENGNPLLGGKERRCAGSRVEKGVERMGHIRSTPGR